MREILKKGSNIDQDLPTRTLNCSRDTDWLVIPVSLLLPKVLAPSLSHTALYTRHTAKNGLVGAGTRDNQMEDQLYLDVHYVAESDTRNTPTCERKLL